MSRNNASVIASNANKDSLLGKLQNVGYRYIVSIQKHQPPQHRCHFVHHYLFYLGGRQNAVVLFFS